MEMITKYLIGNLPQVLTTLIGLGAVWMILGKATQVLKEVSELLNAIVVALADKKLTKEEIDAIIKEAKDIPLVVKALLKKS